MSRNSVIFSQLLGGDIGFPLVVTYQRNDGVEIQTKFVAIDSKPV